MRLGHAEGAGPASGAEAFCPAATDTAGIPKGKLDLGTCPSRVSCCPDPDVETGFCCTVSELRPPPNVGMLASAALCSAAICSWVISSAASSPVLSGCADFAAAAAAGLAADLVPNAGFVKACACSHRIVLFGQFDHVTPYI